MAVVAIVESPQSVAMDALCERLQTWAPQWRSTVDWPYDALSLCARAGVYRWFAPRELGGMGWSEDDQIRGYVRLAAADLTTTFIITQYMGACRRIAGSENREVAQIWLPRLLSGEAFATVGISHLSTSRQYLNKPVLAAQRDDGYWRLSGMSPWVTGAAAADLLVVGATLPDGRELLAAVPTASRGISSGSGAELVALSASKTDRVEFENVRVDDLMVIAGPIANVMASGVGAGTGGLQTSALAIGLSRSAIRFIQAEAERRGEMQDIARELNADLSDLETQLFGSIRGEAGCESAVIRGRANRMVLRATQAALMAAKGAGFVDGHPAGRWCREALFFLVWSCPQGVSQSHLCELAGIVS